METTSQTFARKKPEQLVYLELGSGNGGMLLSMSEDGFRFRSVSPIRSDGLVPFAFSLDGAHRLQGIGEIEWLEHDSKSGGMRFADVSSEFRAAVNKWLASDSRGPLSGREVSPVAATPLDTMEQIREDLRRGYKSAPSGRPETEQAEHANSERAELDDVAEELEKEEIEQLPKHKPAPAPPLRKPTPRKPPEARTTPAPPRHPRPESQRPESRNQEPPWDVPPPPAPPERRVELPRFSTPLEDDRPRVEARPHSPVASSASQPDSSAPKSVVSPAFLSGSAFVSNASPAAAADAPSSPSATSKPPVTNPTDSPEASKPAEAPSYMRTFTLTDTGDVSPSSLQNPQLQYHLHPHSHAHSQPARPIIPPPDVSYDSAWEQSKLTIPQDSPHLSRAAAGAIIGVALAVIIGALAFNFRHDIGSMVIDLGQKISGDKSASPESAVSSPPQTQADTPPDSTPSNEAADPPAHTASAQPAASHPAPAPKKQEASQKQGSSDAASAAEKPAKQYSVNPPTAVANPPKPVPNPSGKVQMVEPNPAGGEVGSGQQEFEEAREILRSSDRKGEIAHAVNLLWSAVRKGYVPAEVTLGDLYRRGEGVEKNCDQAQVLLVTASRRGSPDARRILEFVAEHGCN